MMNMVVEHKLTLNETNMMLAEDANLLNGIPIGIKLTDESCTDYLSLNSLLLGRSTPRIADGPFSAKAHHTEDTKLLHLCFIIVQSLVTQF